MQKSNGSKKTVKIRRRSIFLGLVCIGACLTIAVGVFNVYKPLPEGLSFVGQLRPVDNIVFYRDLTWVDAKEERHSQQEIFDTVLKMIGGAREFIVLDMFLYNDFIGLEQAPFRKLAQEITNALIVQKTKFPQSQIVVITDPINTVYYGMTNHYFESLRARNIQVVYTHLETLRDSNPIYSSFWRIFIKPFGNSPGTFLPNPFGRGRVSLRSWLTMFNFKANHRKLILCDSEEGYSALVTSANPHDGSSAHGNAAVYFTGPAVLDLLYSENVVLGFSEGSALPFIPAVKPQTADSETRIQVLTENKIKAALISAIDRAEAGDKLAVVVFYLSDRDVIHALAEAHKRGAIIRILLDPNKDAFGRKKNGIPNRQVAAELVKLGISVRWSDTHGEQAHTKMILAEYQNGERMVLLGSANFTRRNLDDLNLETDIAVYTRDSVPFLRDVRNYIDLLWYNSDEKRFSTDYSEYADKSSLRRLLYRWMEATGMSTF
jgi:phosphatidylserine/phosphatidylglycerophosphate/cardiolipin synthase-like enzyme